MEQFKWKDELIIIFCLNISFTSIVGFQNHELRKMICKIYSYMCTYLYSYIHILWMHITLKNLPLIDWFNNQPLERTSCYKSLWADQVSHTGSRIARIPTGNGGKAELPQEVAAPSQAGPLESSQQHPGACTEHQKTCWRSEVPHTTGSPWILRQWNPTPERHGFLSKSCGHCLCLLWAAHGCLKPDVWQQQGKWNGDLWSQQEVAGPDCKCWCAFSLPVTSVTKFGKWPYDCHCLHLPAQSRCYQIWRSWSF